MNDKELKERMIKSAMSAIIGEASNIAGSVYADISAQKALEIASNLCAKLQELHDSITD